MIYKAQTKHCGGDVGSLSGFRAMKIQRQLIRLFISIALFLGSEALNLMLQFDQFRCSL